MSLPGVVPFLGEGLMPPGLMPAPKLHRIIVWFRRDLRVEDNPALATAMQLAEEVVSAVLRLPAQRVRPLAATPPPLIISQRAPRPPARPSSA
jgi:hypothetical protein